jgi:hypothetical protein
MTTVAEFIEYLKTLPPETTIKVMEECHSNYSVYTSWTDLELPDQYGSSDNAEFFDFKDYVCLHLGQS